MLKKSIATLILLITACGALSAQNAFETVDVAIGGDLILGGNSILDEWSSAPGFSLELRSPYYFGNFEVGTRYLRYNEATFPDSGFRSIFLFIGWHYPWQITDRFSISSGLRVGNHFLYQDNAVEYFSDPPADPFVFHKNESEFAYEIGLRLHYDISENLSLFTVSSYNRTLLQIPFSVVYANIGIARTFSTPEWLQKFVK